MGLFAGLAAGLLAAGAVLLVPVDLGFRVVREERARGALSVGWMFGLLRKELEVGRPGRRERRKRRREGKRSRRRGAAARLVALARTRGFPTRCLRLAGQLLGQVRIVELSLRGRVGLGDPADTGLLFGALAPALGGLGACRAVYVRLEPDFEGECLAGRASGAVRLVPGRILWVLVRFLLSRETLRAAWSLARRRR